MAIPVADNGLADFVDAAAVVVELPVLYDCAWTGAVPELLDIPAGWLLALTEET